MNRFIFDPAAVQDLEQIWDYIAADSPDAAERQINRIIQTIETIAESPGIGHRRNDLTRYQLLFFPVDSYLLIYRLGNACVEVVGVIHGARDVPTLLRDRLGG